MDDSRISLQKKKGEDTIPHENKDDERNLSLNKNGKDRIPPNKKHVDNQGLRKEPYIKVCTLEEADSVTLFTEKYYKVAIGFALTLSRMRPIGYVSSTVFGPNLLLENLLEPDWLVYRR